MEREHRIFVVEDSRRRAVTLARDAGAARLLAACVLHGCAEAPERDALVVRDPEEEEIQAFEAYRATGGSGMGDFALTLVAEPWRIPITADAPP